MNDTIINVKKRIAYLPYYTKYNMDGMLLPKILNIV